MTATIGAASESTWDLPMRSIRAPRLLALSFLAALACARAEPTPTVTLQKSGAGPSLAFGEEGHDHFVRIEGSGRGSGGVSCTVQAPEKGWSKLVPNTARDSDQYSTLSLRTSLADKCDVVIHRIGARHAIVESSRGCAKAFRPACDEIDFDGIYGPADGSVGTDTESLRETLRQADATMNARFEALRPLLAPNDRIRRRQSAWERDRERQCAQFASEPDRVACEIAVTEARTAIFETYLRAFGVAF